MCGIATIFAYSPEAPPVDRAELLRIRERMTARGPDGCGEWYSPDGRVGLAHRRLAIIDLTEGGSQPMASADGRLVITFNGEIYNFRELRAGLEARGRTFRSNSDTEVLLQLYDERGPEMLHDLRGMYAFAVWDCRENSLFLARDPFGIKPLYYADDGKTIRVASQVKALLAGGQVDTSPEPAGHVGFMLWGSVPEPYTLYRGIRSLPAGSFLRIVRNPEHRTLNLEPQVFCSIPHEMRQAAERTVPLSRDQAQEQLRTAMLDTVRHHLLADVPVGVFLSSGLDSTTLAALTAEVAPGALHTVTLGFKEFAGTADDEVPLAEEIARIYGAQHRTVQVERRDFQDELPRLLDAMDQPSTDGVNSYFVCKAAQQAGLKVVLSGLGGDELFGSYPSFRQIPCLVKNIHRFDMLPGLGRGFRLVSASIMKHFTSPKYAGLLEYGGSYGGAYLLRRGMYMPWELPGLLEGEMVREGWNELQTLIRLEDTARDLPSPHLKISSLEMCWYMRSQLLRDTDWASMAHSLEVRVPLVDLELLRTVVPLFCQQVSISKKDMARTPSTPLPEFVVNREKTGFTVPVREWLREGKAGVGERSLRGWAQETYGSPQWNFRKPSNKRVLVACIASRSGGLQQMGHFIGATLREEGYEPIFAYYMPYSLDPTLSVPFFQLPWKKIGSKSGEVFSGYENHAIGAWLPELEFTNYHLTNQWRELIASCAHHISVSGNCLAATPYLQAGKPFLSWVATPWHEDRKDRVKDFPWYRRVLDASLNSPVLRRLEQRILRNGNILALSTYTENMLNEIAGETVVSQVLRMPIDPGKFYPDRKRTITGRIGFTGRFKDPRKNIGLLLDAVSICKKRGIQITAELVGDELDAYSAGRLAVLEVEGDIIVTPYIQHAELLYKIQEFDLFVIPSFQEGLCIAGLEAMACGCPVISTRCGGPEEFVIDDQNGYLVDFDARQMADSISRIVTDRHLRDRLSANAVAMVRDKYSPAKEKLKFWEQFHRTF